MPGEPEQVSCIVQLILGNVLSPRVACEDTSAVPEDLEDQNYDSANAKDKVNGDDQDETAPGDDLDPKKICWLCHLDSEAIHLKICEGCMKVEKFFCFLCLFK